MEQSSGRIYLKGAKPDELMRALWPDTVVEENNLSQSISAIRKALGDSSQEQRYIETVPGWGYRFAAKVTIISDAKSVEVIRSDELPARRPDHKSLITGVAVATLLIAGVVFYFSLFAGLASDRGNSELR